jgi:N-ethylmaleimide reductase
VAFGKLAISNPDLPERIARGAEPAPWDESTFYVGGAKGYVE